MIFKEPLAIFLFVLWIISIFVFNFKKMSVMRFFMGTFGGFISTIYFARTFLEELFNNINLNILSIVFSDNKYMSISDGISAVQIYSHPNTFSYIINHESSAIIETLVYINILIFYPIFKGAPLKKLLVMMFGVCFIMASNVLRITILSYLIVLLGTNWFFVINVVFSRIFFIGLNILLFYLTITLPHLKAQTSGTYVVVNEQEGIGENE